MADDVAREEPPKPRRGRRRRTAHRRLVQTPVLNTGYRFAWRPPTSRQLLGGLLSAAALATATAAILASRHAAAELAQGAAAVEAAERGYAAGRDVADRLEASARTDADGTARGHEVPAPLTAGLAPAPAPVGPATRPDDPVAAPAQPALPLATPSVPAARALPDRNGREMAYTLPGGGSGQANTVAPDQQPRP